jgi:uncharacterized protein (DUF2141 family)
MRALTVPAGRALLAAALAAIAVSAAAAQSRRPSCAIAVEMSGFRSDKGKALVALFRTAKGFPDKPAHALRRVPVVIRKGKARVTLGRLPPGPYAVAVLHDEDDNRKMKTGFLGRPAEGYGSSRDARGRFGPPRFEDARLTLRAGQTLRAPIRMVYH